MIIWDKELAHILDLYCNIYNNCSLDVTEYTDSLMYALLKLKESLPYVLCM